jgi:hypothetical protein
MNLFLRRHLVVALVFLAYSALTWAQQEPTPEMLKAKEFFETAGIPGDKWIEGETMGPHVCPVATLQRYHAVLPRDGRTSAG